MIMAVMADESTVTGFLLTGIGERNKKGDSNFHITDKATEDADLELIFSRFGRIESCDIVRDWKTGDSLNFAFIAFEEEKSDSASRRVVVSSLH